MFGRQENINIHVSLDTTSLEVYVKNDTPTFSGLSTFNGPILNNDTLTQVGTSTFTGVIAADGGITGDVTGKLIPASGGSITSRNSYDIVYDVNGPNNGGFFRSHYFNCNATMVLAINEYSFNLV